MKTIGLLGGMSWESTLEYYRAINQGVNAQLGGLHSAQIAMRSIDFAPLEEMQAQGDWDSAANMIVEAAQNIAAAGADCLLICTNTMHKVAPKVEAALDIPLLHIADATALKLLSAKQVTVGLLGTAFTMEQDFYKGRLQDKFGLAVIVPDQYQRKIVHDVIYQELCHGVIRDESRKAYLDIIQKLAERGAQAIVLGCTEIGLLVSQNDTDVPLVDTTAIHAQAAVDYALAGK